MKFQYDRRQLRAMCFVASLAPVTRLLPKAAAQLAGSASWLAPLCALPPLLLFLLILTSLMKMRREGEGLGEVIMRRSGRTAGAIGLALIGSFTLFSAGFILRTGAHRLISTIYPDAGPLFFMIAMLIIGTVAALGPVKALPRASRVFAPVLLSVIVLALIFSLGSVDVRNLLPIKTQSERCSSPGLPSSRSTAPYSTARHFWRISHRFRDGALPHMQAGSRLSACCFARSAPSSSAATARALPRARCTRFSR